MDLTVKAETVKRLEENIGEYIHNFGAGKDFFHEIPKALTSKERKIDKLDVIKSESFYLLKDS